MNSNLSWTVVPFLGGNVRRTKGVELESCQAVPVPTTNKHCPRSRSNRNTNTSSIVKSIQKGVGKNET